MSIKFAVVTEFKGDASGQVRAVNKMTASVKGFGRQSEKSFKKASRSAKGFDKITKGILKASIIQKGLGLLSEGVRNVSAQFVDFDDAITAAAVRFKDIGPDAINFADQLQTIKTAAREAGAKTIFTATQNAKALDFLARAGFRSTVAMGSLNSMINLSVATGEDFASVADMSSDLLGAFGLAVKDSGQKIKNLNRLNNVLVKTANSANVTVADMFETMKIGAPIADDFGASLEEVASLTAVMGNAGIKGSQGATAIKNIFTRLSAPTKEVAKGLAKINLSQKDFIKDGKRIKITEILELIGKNLKNIAEPRRLGVIKEIFGAFAIAGGSKLVKSIENIKEFNDLVNNAGDVSQKTADVMGKSLGNRIKLLGSAFQDLGFSIITPFEEDIKGAITSLTKMLNDASKAVEDFANRNNVSAKSAADNRKAIDELNKVQETTIKQGQAISRFTAFQAPGIQRGPARKFGAKPGQVFGGADFGGKTTASTKAFEQLIDKSFGKQGEGLSQSVKDFVSRNQQTRKVDLKSAALKDRGLLGLLVPQRQSPSQGRLDAQTIKAETKSRIDVNFANAPPNTTATGETSGAESLNINGLSRPAALAPG